MKTNNSDFLMKLYAETLSLITVYGAKGWTVDTICQKNGIAKDTFYRIIKNKEKLIENVLLQETDLHMSGIVSLMNMDKDFFDVLRRIVASLSTFFIKIPSEKLGTVFLEYPSLEKAINERMESSFENIENFINKGKSSGHIKETVDSGLIVRIIHVCMMQFIKKPETYNAGKDIERLLDYLIEGIKK